MRKDVGQSQAVRRDVGQSQAVRRDVGQSGCEEGCSTVRL